MEPEDNIILKKIKDRKCICGEPIKNYVFSSILLPLENTAVDLINDSTGNFDFSFFPWDRTDMRSWYKIILSSECEKCGRISLWSAKQKEVSILCSDDMEKEGYGIILIYDKKKIEKYKEKTKLQFIKKNLEDLLKGFKV